MKRALILSVLCVAAAWSTDFSQMSTEELMQLRGTLSPSERPAFRAEMQKRMQSMSPEQRQQMMQGRGMGRGMGQNMRGQGKGMQNRPTYADYDLNRDGKITADEFSKAQASRMTQRANQGKMMKNAGNAPTFEMIDANKDGIISQAEFNAHQLQQRNKMRGGKGRSM
ncbi:MAG: DUF1104 domain-containing protein [Sulfurovum sp.]|nr:DUF1104 domain-containing protein [Sulfurovum sp.]